MEFWGVEVKAGEKLKVQPEFGQLIHISQASLGEVKDAKSAKYVPLRMKIDNKSFIIGSLSAEERPQVMFDLVFEREFELSHDWKNGSIYFIGYIADDPVSDEELSSDDEESEEEPVLEAQGNGVVAKAKAGAVKATEKAAAVAAKAGANDKAKEEEKDSSDDDDEDDDSESDSDDEMALDGVPQIGSSDDSEDDSDDEDDDASEEEELPKVQQSKKRPAPTSEKTPLAKKAKAATPDKTGKKGQNATPAQKSAGKTPNKQTPKSGGQLSCKSCPKTFNSEVAMQSHAKAKHGGK